MTTCSSRKTGRGPIAWLLVAAVLVLQTDNACAFQCPRAGSLPRLPLPRIQQSVSSQVASAFTSAQVDNEARLSAPELSSDEPNIPCVPTTIPDAVRTFLFDGDYGPLYVACSILIFACWRVQISSLEMVDVMVFSATVIFWSFQEHFLHEKVLHSNTDWIGKGIHQRHHDRPFYHVSIDPAPLLLGWMLAAHLAFRMLLPLPVALTATVAYSMSGLFYEWAHYIVHTKVRFQSKFWKRVKENHLRHHVVSDEYWFAFSFPGVDDLFHTNPSVRQVRKQLEEEKRRTAL